MNLVNYLQFLEPVQEHFSRIYSTASEVIAVILVLWCINLLAGLIQRTFSTGKIVGRLYRAYIHPYLKAIVVRLHSLVFKRNTIINGRTTDSIQT